MREADAHLTLDEIFLALRPEDREVDGSSFQGLRNHLAECAECALTIDQYRGVMAELNPFKRGGKATVNDECPSPGIWGQVAAGLRSKDDVWGILQHAALCSACSVQLKEALEIVGTNAPPESRLQQALQTGTSRRQKSLAAEMAARSRQVIQSEAAPGPLPFKKPSRTFRLPVWAYGAVAAVLILGVAPAVFTGVFGRGSGSTERLLAQAYAQQRTVELRISGAGYGPVRVERGQKQSQMSSPGVLLEAEAAIKKGLEQHPDDPNLLRQKAEADLLNWDYQPAIEALGHALRIQPQSPKILVDLATAHFERAEATSSQPDYESALQYLSDALRLSPAEPAALFNRAIVYERLFLYSSAVADWELLLTHEGDAEWKREAQKRLDDLRSRQQRHSIRDAPDHLTPAEFKSAVENKTTLDPEQYIELAERRILPGIFQPDQRELNYQLAVLLAQHFEAVHSDRFFTDLLKPAGQPGFHSAVRLLAAASTSNSAGHSEEAYENALDAARFFAQSGNIAGQLASRFEEIYALQFESKASTCLIEAAELALKSKRSGFAWLEIQGLLEAAICSNMTGDLGKGKELAQKAVGLARDHDYQSLYLRGLSLLGVLEGDAGDESGAWAAIREGLQQYWTGSAPPMRAYTFYVLIDRMAERLGHANVQFAGTFESLQYVAGGPDHLLEAAERSRLAQAALRLGLIKVAEEQFAQAARLFASVPETASTQRRELETKIGLAKVQSLRGNHTEDALATLMGYLPEVKRLSNRYIDFQYYTTLAELKMKSEPESARQWLTEAIRLADNALRSLHTWRERLTWTEQNRQAYLIMTQLLMRAGKDQSALELWERFRTASPAPPRPAAISAHPSVSQPLLAQAEAGDSKAILTYAFTTDGIMIWMHNRKEVHSTYVPVAISEFNRTAENFLQECARADSSLQNLRADGHDLFAWLLQPLSQWLPRTGHLTIEPDGILGTLPLQALVDNSGQYLEDRYTIAIAPAMVASRALLPATLLSNADRVLIVAAPANSKIQPPPGAMAEGDRIAQKFLKSTLLWGREATLSNVRSEILQNGVFHYAGHATAGRAGAAMLLADGSLAVAGHNDAHNRVFDPLREEQRLTNLKLAVFSACATAYPGEMSQSASLVTEFLQAGTPAVVASHWNVDSEATADFMELFYQSALAGRTVAGALQNAATRFRATPGRQHPYYWAAFSVFGNA